MMTETSADKRNYRFREAVFADQPVIWEILQAAILRRKADGSNQWQDGYPNPAVVRRDIEKCAGYVLTIRETVVGYTAVFVNDEPAYAHIWGEWRTNGPFVVFHWVAIATAYLQQGLAPALLRCIEVFARSQSIYSLKADTNFDNPAMMKIFDKLGYVYYGEVSFKGSTRMAYEKVLEKE